MNKWLNEKFIISSSCNGMVLMMTVLLLLLLLYVSLAYVKDIIMMLVFV